jgi:hypothetical protein
MPFRITAATSGGARLVSDERLHPEDFRAIAAQLQQSPIRARKVGYIAAREARRCETVDTQWNDTETTNIARPGDWIVTNLSPEQEPLLDRHGSLNVYVIGAADFRDLYEPTAARNQHGAIYRPKGVVEALHLPGGFDILAPWGERQRGLAGFLVLNDRGQVYAVHTEVFAATYAETA